MGYKNSHISIKSRFLSIKTALKKKKVTHF